MTWNRTLDSIPEKKWIELKENVERAGGRVILLVHPFYGVGTASYFSTIQKLLRNSKVPIVILDEQEKMDSWGWRKTRSTMLVIPTSIASPFVIIRNNSNGTEVRDFHFTTISKKLKAAGVRKIMLGGTHSIFGHYAHEIKKHESKKRPGWRVRETTGKTLSIGCVGDAYLKLLRTKEFDDIVLIPKALFPDQPEYYTQPKRTIKRKGRTLFQKLLRRK